MPWKLIQVTSVRYQAISVVKLWGKKHKRLKVKVKKIDAIVRLNVRTSSLIESFSALKDPPPIPITTLVTFGHYEQQVWTARSEWYYG